MEVICTYNFCPSLVLEAFVGATSQDPSILKKAEAHLKSWETQPGFYSAVASIFLDTNIDANVRWIAAMYFKNGIDRYWRKNAPSGISEEEKTYLKHHLLESFNEPILQIASQVAILIGKIARHDCPRFWPSLVPVLIQSLQSTDSNQPIRIQRATLTFYQVVKAMVSKKLPADRKVFEELTTSTFELIFNKWKQSFDELFISLEARQQANLSMLLSYCVLLTKILKKLLVYGFSEIRDVQMCRQFLMQAIQKLDSMLQSKQLILSYNMDELLAGREKLIVLLTKVLLETLETHAEGFGEFVGPTLQFVVSYCFTPGREELVFERFLINMMNLMKDVLKCEKYKVYKTSNEDQQKNRLPLMVQNVKVNFFTVEMLRQLVEQLLLQYFLLKNDELHCWDTDPESFISEESGDSWKFSWRPCVESLFLSLTKEFKDIVCPIIMQLVNQYLLSDSSQHYQSNDIIGLLKIDAVYNAVGLSTYHLYDFIDFDQWFNNRLIHELTIGDGNDGGGASNSHVNRNYRIIKRRVIWLIGKWVGVKMSANHRPRLYAVIQSLLSGSEDVVVKLETVNALKSAVDDVEFHVEQYMPYLEVHFKLLFDLLKSVLECETKLSVLHVMTLIIERMEADIHPHIHSLVHYLPLLWDASEHHNLLRCAIITNLSMIVQGLGSESVNMHPFLLPVIKTSTDVRQAQHVYLCEDALHLWLHVMQSCNVLTNDILLLFENVANLLDQGTEELKIIMKITETYIMIDSDVFLQRYHELLSSCLHSLLNEVKFEGEVMVFKLITLMLQLSPDITCNIFQDILCDSFKFVAGIATAGNSTTGTVANIQCPPLTTSHVIMTSRLLIHSSHSFLQLVNHLSGGGRLESIALVDRLVEGLLNKFDCLYQADKKKICILALLSLLQSQYNRSVLSNINGVLGVVVDALHDVCKEDSNGRFVDNLLIVDEKTLSSVRCDEDNDYDISTDVMENKHHQIIKKDPVHSICLLSHVRSQLDLLQMHCPNFNEEIEFEVLQQLKHFLCK